MKRIVLVHWNAAEATEKARFLTQADLIVAPYADQSRDQMLSIRDQPPDAFVIDLSRLPSQGVEFAIWLRQQKNTRHIPILFTGGAPEKIARARQVLPDAPVVDWQELAPAIHDAIQHPVPDPVVPGSFDSYSGTPLSKKLGIRDGSFIVTFNAPAEIEQGLGPLPVGSRIERIGDWSGEPPAADIILLYVQSQTVLEQDFPKATKVLTKKGRLWIIWPKKASGIPSDLSERVVRAFGLGSGFVDYKISAIDQTWSGLCFARRQASEPG